MTIKKKKCEMITARSRVGDLVAFAALVALCAVVIVSVLSDTVRADSVSESIIQADSVINHDGDSETVKKEKTKRKFDVFVTVDGNRKKFSVSSGTVGDIVRGKSINADSDDIVSYPYDTPLKKNMEIKIRRVEYRFTEKTKMIAFKTETNQSADLYEGESRVERVGEKGEDRNFYLIKTVDGTVKNEIYLSTRRAKNPVSEIVAFGTKKRMIEKGSIGQSGFSSRTAVSQIPAAVDIVLDMNGKPINYKQKIVGAATAYCGGGTTSRGKAAMPGRVAVDPKEIPYGSKLFIVSSDGKYIYGYCEAWDTGGFIHTTDNVVDLYFSSFDECIGFGRRSVEIYVIE